VEFEKLDLLVVCDPYPTSWSVLSGRKEWDLLLPACTSFEMDGSAHRLPTARFSGAKQIVKPVFETKNRLRHHVICSPASWLCRQTVQNIKVDNGAVSAEDILLREINRGGWSTGYAVSRLSAQGAYA